MDIKRRLWGSRFLPALTAIACSLFSSASAVAAPSPAEGAERLEGQIHFIMDPREELEIKDILGSNRWTPVLKISDLPPFYSGAIWYSVELKNPGFENDDWILIFDLPGPRLAEFYIPRPDGSFRRAVTGDAIPAPQKSIRLRKSAVDITLPKGQSTTLYARTVLRGGIPPSLWTVIPARELDRYRSQDENLLMLVFGFMLALLLSNFLYFLILRDKNFFNYLVLNAVLSVHIFVFSGADHFLPHSGPPFTDWFFFSYNVAVVASLQFGRVFLKTRKQFPRFDFVLRAQQVVHGILAALAWNNPSGPVGMISGQLFMLHALLLLVISVILVFRGFRPARLYLLSWVCIMGATVVFGLWQLGIIREGNVFIPNAVAIGFALDMLVLSFALADNINHERRRLIEKINMQHAARIEALGQLAGGIAHEINNPLTVISLRAHGLTDLAFRLGPPESTALEKTAATITRTVERIASIVGGLRVFSREGGAGPKHLTPIKNIIQDALDLNAKRLQGSGIQLEYTPPSEGLVVYCRPNFGGDS